LRMKWTWKPKVYRVLYNIVCECGLGMMQPFFSCTTVMTRQRRGCFSMIFFGNGIPKGPGKDPVSAQGDPVDTELAKTNFQEDKEKMTDQIQQLESENLNLKPWHLIGEVTSKGRPENSLLDQSWNMTK